MLITGEENGDPKPRHLVFIETNFEIVLEECFTAWTAYWQGVRIGVGHSFPDSCLDILD